jgi:hypothetical protein
MMPPSSTIFCPRLSVTFCGFAVSAAVARACSVATESYETLGSINIDAAVKNASCSFGERLLIAASLVFSFSRAADSAIQLVSGMVSVERWFGFERSKTNTSLAKYCRSESS